MPSFNSNANWPPRGGSGGGGVASYPNFAAFPSAGGVGNGALAIDLSTDIIYISNGTIWTKLADPNFSPNAIIGLTGDGTATGPGNVALTLATVNAGPGTFGTAANVGTFIVNAKGLITSGVNTPIQIAESQVTNLVTDLAGKQPAGAYVTSLTGDVTGTGPGATATTLATVNASPGSYGIAASVPTVTVNAKGLVTTAVNTPIQIAESQVTNLTTDLAAKQPLSSELTALAAAATTGIVTRTAANTYVQRTITTTAAVSGLVTTNGDGVAGNPSLVVDIHGTTLKASPVAADEVLIYDVAGVALKRATTLSLLSVATSSFVASWTTGTTQTFTHNLNTLDIIVQVYDIATGSTILVDTTTRASVNTVTLTVPTAPSGAGWRVVVLSTGSVAYGTGGGAVSSVNSRSGVVVLTSADVGLSNVNNTSDINKPVSTAQQGAINASAASAYWYALAL